MTATKRKRCGACGVTKPVDDFCKQAARKDRLSYWCRQCCRIYQKSPKGKAARVKADKKYRQTDKSKAVRRKAMKKYRNTIEGYLYVCHWQMEDRCNNSKLRDYKSYGGRGIKCLITFDELYHHIVIVLGYNTVKKLEGLTIDREDVNGHYEVSNLRIATPSQQRMNSRKQSMWRGQVTSSKYKGVSRVKRLRKWLGKITKDGKFYQKLFDDEIKAAQWYDLMAIELFGRFACTNAMLGLL